MWNKGGSKCFDNLSSSVFVTCTTAIIILVCQAGYSNAHLVSIPGSTTIARISKFPFYQKIVNPCGVSIGVPTESPVSFREQSTTAFTRDFIASMGVAINLTIDALEEVQKAVRDESVSCDGVTLVSLPPPASLLQLNEMKTMSTLYKSGIYLIAHLHLVTLDRTIGALDDSDDENDIEDLTPTSCENEPRNYVPLVSEFTRRLENVMCAIITGANWEQRANFRRPLQELEATKLYRYHGSCTSMQTRDCIVLNHAEQLMGNYRRKLKRLSVQLLQQQRRPLRNRQHYMNLHELGSMLEDELNNQL